MYSKSMIEAEQEPQFFVYKTCYDPDTKTLESEPVKSNIVQTYYRYNRK